MTVELKSDDLDVLTDALLAIGLTDLAKKFQQAQKAPYSEADLLIMRHGSFVRAGRKGRWCVRCPVGTQTGDVILVSRRDKSSQRITVGELVYSTIPSIRHIQRKTPK